MTPLRQRVLEELQRRNYTIDTIRGYLLAVEQFAHYLHKSSELMGAEEIGQFQLHLLQEKKLAVGMIALRNERAAVSLQEDLEATRSGCFPKTTFHRTQTLASGVNPDAFLQEVSSLLR